MQNKDSGHKTLILRIVIIAIITITVATVTGIFAYIQSQNTDIIKVTAIFKNFSDAPVSMEMECKAGTSVADLIISDKYYVALKKPRIETESKSIIELWGKKVDDDDFIRVLLNGAKISTPGGTFIGSEGSIITFEYVDVNN